MARLPTPGGDTGNWGAILNDFINQAHAADGLLKAAVVGQAQLQDNAVVATKIADGAVSAAKLQANSITADKILNGAITSEKLAAGAQVSADGLRSLAIYYAPPVIINGRYSENYAAGVLSRYDDVVLGSGLEVPADPNYATTVSIMAKVAALSPRTVIWGYIDCSITYGNLSLAALQVQIDQWVTIGAGGIFCDVIGYAYGVTRSRQNSIINYIHSKGIGAILNVYNPDEIFGSAVDATYNPGGVATAANNKDVHLLESWAFNSDSYPDPYFCTFSDLKVRGDASRVYRESLGIRLFSSGIVVHTGKTESELNLYRGLSESLARTWRLDGAGISPSTYSATGIDAGKLVPRYWQLRSNELHKSAPYVLNGGWTEVEATDLGITVHFEAGSHTWQQL